MRILFVTPYVPSPIRVRPFHFLRQLARRHDVVALSIWQSEREYQDLIALRSVCPVIGVRLSRAQVVRNCLSSLPSRIPLQGSYCRSPEIEDLIVRLAGRGSATLEELPAELRAPFDVVHVEHLRAAYVGFLLPREWPKLFDSVDSISLLLRRTVRGSHSLRKRALAAFELARTRHYEARILNHFDRITVTAPGDAEALRELAPAAAVTVVPNGVDLDYFRPVEGPRDETTLVLSGKMSYHANVTAVLYFVREIFPRIKWVRPGVRLRIVGSDPVRAVRALARDPAISVTGHVEDMREAIGHAAVAVCPVTVKVGVQNKILEAMALGLPVVSTVEGLDGLQAEPELDVLLGRTPGEFADQVCRLLSDPGLRERIGQAGHRYVERHHRWDAAARQLEDLYREAVEGRAREARSNVVTPRADERPLSSHD